MAVAALAAAALGLEIAFARLLSALFVTNLVGALLSTALLGLGCGAAAASARRSWRGTTARAFASSVAALLAAAAVPATLAAAVLGQPLLALAALAAAFTAIGWTLTASFAAEPHRASALYRVDLSAAAAAALATPLALDAFGGLGGSIAAGLPLTVAAWALRPPGRFAGPLVASIAGIVLATAHGTGALTVDPGALATAKPLRALLRAGAEITATRWDAFARTDRVRTADGAVYLFADGAAGSLIPGPEAERWERAVAGFAFVAGARERVFLIGSGGGLDAALAARYGADDIVAIELNAAGVALTDALVDGGYPAGTDLRLGEGRRELARERARGGAPYDVILLANVVTGAAELSSAAATEHRAHTVEAFREFLTALTPTGHLALAPYDEATLTRGITTALTALVEGGWARDHAEATTHLAAVLETRGDRPAPLLLVRPTPWSRDEAIALARTAEARSLRLLLIPHLLSPPPLTRVAAGELTLAGLIAAGGGVDLRPTRDQAPYFFTLTTGLPSDTRAALAAAAAIAAALLAAPWLRAAASRLRHRRRVWRCAAAHAHHMGIAAGLGVGFLAVQLHALSRVQAAVGHPAWALSLALGALLLGGAVGAGMSRRAGSIAGGAAAAGVAALALAPASTALHQATLGASPWLAAAAQGALLLAIGIPLGMPFPRLLRARKHGVASAWVASALASVAVGGMAGAVTRTFGIPALGALGAGGYAVAALLASAWHAEGVRCRRRGGSHPPKDRSPRTSRLLRRPETPADATPPERPRERHPTAR